MLSSPKNKKNTEERMSRVVSRNLKIEMPKHNDEISKLPPKFFGLRMKESMSNKNLIPLTYNRNKNEAKTRENDASRQFVSKLNPEKYSKPNEPLNILRKPFPFPIEVTKKDLGINMAPKQHSIVSNDTSNKPPLNFHKRPHQLNVKKKQLKPKLSQISKQTDKSPLIISGHKIGKNSEGVLKNTANPFIEPKNGTDLFAIKKRSL